MLSASSTRQSLRQSWLGRTRFFRRSERSNQARWGQALHLSKKSFSTGSLLHTVVIPALAARHDVISVDNPFFQQVRWKRKDGNRFHMQERPPTKKQRKVYNRQLKEARMETEKHGKPGSKAGARRQWAKQWKEDILNPVPDMPMEELEKYSVDDALLDDLMGNTKSAQPTPEPKYLGHRHRHFYNRVADQMDDYRRKLELLTSGDEQALSGMELLDLQHAELPSDKDISLVLRAFRDRQGTRRKPVGIVKALEHLLQDLGVPVTSFGEMTYTTLLTCAQSPAEGRRIIHMMKQQQHPVSSYSWSILVDVYAKVGDYKGCMEVHREMIAEGITPTIPSFTSLLAACYKVCIDGRISHKLRDEAAKVAWDQWQEMRIIGCDPDVMAYGAILRIMAARGKPERALNILEEMQYNGVAPTTLCFTSALRAVSRSHATAIRYEQGSTRRNSRREFITAHHGKLAQAIVRLAENAEVEQDNGFIAALISCAAAAGDLATAKAIYVANQIRRLDHFRTIGSDDHLARLRGEGNNDDLDQLEWNPELLSDGTSVPQSATEQQTKAIAQKSTNKRHRSYGEREYGKDSRILSAVMQACANSAGNNMVGSMWQGRENEGYLCENSLRLLSARPVPEYEDNSIPGAGRTDNLTWAGDEKDLDRRGKKRMSGKFTGVHEDDSVPMSLDELDDTFARYFVDKEGRRKPEYQKVTPRDIWNERYGSKSGINEAYGNPRVEADVQETKALTGGSPKVEAAPMHFNPDTMRWEAGPPKESVQSPVEKPALAETTATKAEVEEELYFDTDTLRWKTRPKLQSNQTEKDQSSHEAGSTTTSWQGMSTVENPQELHFDADEKLWKVKEDPTVADGTATEYDGAMATQTKTVQFNEEEYAAFIAELKQDILESGGDPSDVDEEEARELFFAIQDEDSELMKLLEEEEDDDEATQAFTDKLASLGSAEDSPAALQGSSKATSPMTSAGRSTNVLDFDTNFDTSEYDDNDDDSDLFSEDSVERLTEEIHAKASLQDLAPHFEDSVEVVDEEIDAELEELRAVLPAFSDRRLRKVQKAFAKNLGDPSLLDLVKISREIMPDFVTNTWLKHMSILTARYVMKQAIQEGLLDVHMLNGVLQLETSLGRLDRALEFYQTEFAKHHMVPTAYSDRLVVQMFLQNNRFSRALSFKDRIENDGRTLDLQSYGSLIDYCARRGQVGSSMLLLHECLHKHGGAQPGQTHLAQLRIAYRRSPDLDERDLEALIGPDPIRWLKHGERHLKREMSKKGRRDVRLAQNVLLQV